MRDKTRSFDQELTHRRRSQLTSESSGFSFGGRRISFGLPHGVSIWCFQSDVDVPLRLIIGRELFMYRDIAHLPCISSLQRLQARQISRIAQEFGQRL
jgi:hypothetical protein